MTEWNVGLTRKTKIVTKITEWFLPLSRPQSNRLFHPLLSFSRALLPPSPSPLTPRFWKFEATYELFAFMGNNMEDKVVFLGRSGNVELKTTSDATPYPKSVVRPSLDLNITWFLNHINDNGAMIPLSKFSLPLFLTMFLPPLSSHSHPRFLLLHLHLLFPSLPPSLQHRKNVLQNR